MTSRTQPRATVAIKGLAEQVTAIVRADAPAIETARRVAGALGGVLDESDLLFAEQATATPESYCQHVLYADPEGAFSIVAVVWLPGHKTCIHDHIAWCVVGVYQGAEESRLYRVVENGVDEPHLIETGHMIDLEGTTSYFVPPGDIHAVANSSDRKVISIHIYGADVSVLGSSIRRRYDLPVR